MPKLYQFWSLIAKYRHFLIIFSMFTLFTLVVELMVNEIITTPTTAKDSLESSFNQLQLLHSSFGASAVTAKEKFAQLTAPAQGNRGRPVLARETNKYNITADVETQQLHVSFVQHRVFFLTYQPQISLQAEVINDQWSLSVVKYQANTNYISWWSAIFVSFLCLLVACIVTKFPALAIKKVRPLIMPTPTSLNF